MDNLTETILQNFTEIVAEAFTLLPIDNETISNVTVSNVTFSNGTTRKPSSVGGRLTGGYYEETMETLWKVVPPVIIVWGLLGNFLTAMVLCRQMARKVTSTTMYLLSLAFSDSVILLCGPLRNFIKFSWEKDVRDFSDAGCRVQLYLTYASVHMSSWLLVAVTMERVLSVVVPHKVRLGCTPKLAGVVILVTFVCVFALNACVAAINGHDTQVKTYRCAPTSEKYQKFRDDIWNWIDFLTAFAIPFFFLLVGNIIIIVHLCQSVKRKKKMSTSNAGCSQTKSISILLILLCFVFFTTMTPVSVFLIYQPYLLEEIQNLPTFKEAWYAYHYMNFQHAVVNLVGYTNASFNFLMYVLSGSKFRNDLKQMICCCFKKKSTKGLKSSTNTKQTTDGNYSSTTRTRSRTSVDPTTRHEREDTAAENIVKDDKENEQANVDKNDQTVSGKSGVQNATFSDIYEGNDSKQEQEQVPM